MKHFERDISKIQEFRNRCAGKNEEKIGWETFSEANKLGYGEYLEPIVGDGRRVGYHEVLEAISSNIYEGFRFARKTINTYPFGEATDKIYGQLFCVCSGKDSLKASFDYIRSYCKKTMEQWAYSESGERSVVLVTDKWDSELFRKCEKKFLTYALNEKIVFLIYLFTDYGYIQIPFVDPNLIEESAYDPCLDLYEKTLQLPRIGRVRFQIKTETTWGAELDKDEELSIDFDKKSCNYNGKTRKLTTAETERTKIILQRALNADLLMSSGEPTFDACVKKTLILNDDEENAVTWYNDGGMDIQEIQDIFVNLASYMK